MMKLVVMRTATGKGRPRITPAAEDICIICTSDCTEINASHSSRNRHLFRGDFVNEIVMVELLQRNHY
jgi:hypothetical protein